MLLLIMLEARPGDKLTESQLFERTIRRLRKHKVDEHELVCEPTTIDDEPLPLNVLETDWIHKGCKEASEAAK